ncbi:MAG: AzlD domain-containing protein [Fastidiosipilaceae bacterium]|jgi:branched-subunit amino acid transport protein
MSVYLLIFLMALVTFIPRMLPAVLIEKMKFSNKAEKFLGLIPYTAMSALIFPGVLWVDPNHIQVGVIGALAAVLLSLIKNIPIWVVVLISVGVTATASFVLQT